ncbi:uncharacterized protein LOC126908837 [Daktulosphaira vitifoliae]|uniref:uncharacterized protein LOC126908837 n=1 Tax=Daktulosphaira vitifoliae TaxID=58002 RepID=UPI0021AAFE2B|nr:uncharacterized protein LOC126908837 [Daktulosphaira vitifoliae]
MNCIHGKRECNSKIIDIISVMNRRKESNKFLIENDEENLISLKNIYLYDIIENKELLKTIIMVFGEQSEENFNVIYKDIHREYLDAKNYYWYDLWLSQIGKYQNKLLNIFKIILLHLMTKYLIYFDKLRKKAHYFKVQYISKVFKNFFYKKIHLFDIGEQDGRDYQNIINSFLCVPLSKSLLKASISVQMWNIEIMTNNIKPNSFKFVYDNIFDLEYLSRLKSQNDELFLKCGMKKKNFINKLFYKIDNLNLTEWNNNFTRMVLYLHHLKYIFNETSLKIIHSFIKYSKEFGEFYVTRTDEEMSTVRLLEL